MKIEIESVVTLIKRFAGCFDIDSDGKGEIRPDNLLDYIEIIQECITEL